MALEPAWIGVIGTGIGALVTGIPAFGSAVVQSVSARGQRKHEVQQAQAKREADAADAKRQRHCELLDSWRDGIASLGNASYQAAFDTSWYETLRTRLPADVLARLEQPNTIIVSPGSARFSKEMFAREVDRIERGWGLRP
jgi:hypothetical protein